MSVTLLRASHPWSHLILTASPCAKHSVCGELGLAQRLPSALPCLTRVGSTALASRLDVVRKLHWGLWLLTRFAAFSARPRTAGVGPFLPQKRVSVECRYSSLPVNGTHKLGGTAVFAGPVPPYYLHPCHSSENISSSLLSCF